MASPRASSCLSKDGDLFLTFKGKVSQKEAKARRTTFHSAMCGLDYMLYLRYEDHDWNRHDRLN